MNSFQVLGASIISLITLFLIVSLIRTRILRVNYSILWLTVSFLLLLSILRYEWVVRLDAFFDLGGPKNVFFFIIIFFLLAICIQFSLIISALVLKVKNLAQRIALLEYKHIKKSQ